MTDGGDRTHTLSLSGWTPVPNTRTSLEAAQQRKGRGEGRILTPILSNLVSPALCLPCVGPVPSLCGDPSRDDPFAGSGWGWKTGQTPEEWDSDAAQLLLYDRREDLWRKHVASSLSVALWKRTVERRPWGEPPF